MGQTSNIEWTDATWNPWSGCHKISPGCKFCYMFRDKARYGQDPNVVVRSKTTFYAPLQWKEPRLIFTCSWSDWLIEEADPWREEAYDVIRRTPQHTYQILTKRIERAEGRVPNPPFPNVWLGVSVEDNNHRDRIRRLLQTPAAIRFLSLEPLIAPVDLSPWTEEGLECSECPWIGCEEQAKCVDVEDSYFKCPKCRAMCAHTPLDELLGACKGIDWVIVGGESGGSGVRFMQPNWARSIRDSCVQAGVPFFFKQWGEHLPDCQNLSMTEAGRTGAKDWQGIRVGKKAAGRLLDGRTWDQLPEVR